MNAVIVGQTFDDSYIYIYIYIYIKVIEIARSNLFASSGPKKR
jgi:hypothetical protein